jgi:hypothetical protein
VPSVSDTKPGTAGRAALLVLGVLVLVLVPASASARTVYINAELSQEYYAGQPTGEHWQSTAAVSAYYRTTSQALSFGDGTLVLAPAATLGRFTASLSDPLPVVPLSCTWHGTPGDRHQLAELQDGTPFAHALSIQWPGYPSMWDQVRSSVSTPRCGLVFMDDPLEGNVKWALQGATGTGGGNHFIFAAVPRDTAVESHAVSASIAAMTMSSLLTSPDGASYAVTAQGLLVESTVPFAGHTDVLPAPSILAGGKLPRPLSVKALQKLGRKLVPKKVRYRRSRAAHPA